MDTSATYREIVKQIIIQYSKLRPSHGDIRLDPIFDETHDRYALMQVGWDRGRRVRGNLIYVTLQNGKVYIEYDGIEHGITQDLIVIGVSPADIVLAFLPESELAASAGKL
ncbi:MAG: XisI protein [Nostoc sp.]|uniref:XisI protein n=1 Tax=Nostoc sp. TaxID=1180 RepID=UPI002FF6411D